MKSENDSTATLYRATQADSDDSVSDEPETQYRVVLTENDDEGVPLDTRMAPIAKNVCASLQGDPGQWKPRVEFAEKHLEAGMKVSELVTIIRDKFGITERKARKAIGYVLDAWKKDEHLYREVRRVETRERLEYLHDLAVGRVGTPTTVKIRIDEETGDVDMITADVITASLREAIRLEERIARFEGLDAAKKLELSGEVKTSGVLVLPSVAVPKPIIDVVPEGEDEGE